MVRGAGLTQCFSFDCFQLDLWFTGWKQRQAAPNAPYCSGRTLLLLSLGCRFCNCLYTHNDLYFPKIDRQLQATHESRRDSREGKKIKKPCPKAGTIFFFEHKHVKLSIRSIKGKNTRRYHKCNKNKLMNDVLIFSTSMYFMSVILFV